MSDNVNNERSRRGLRKVKSLNLRKPEDLKQVTQDVQELVDLMNLKKILFAGEVFDKETMGNDKGNVMKNKMKLNAQAKENSKKSTGVDPEEVSVTEDTPTDEPVEPVPINDTEAKPREWDDVKPSIKEEFWKELREIEGEYHYGIAVKGWRKTMEDTFDAKSSLDAEIPNLFGVYDGHGGSSCSTFCENFLLRKLAKNPAFHTRPKKCLEDTFFNVDSEYGKSFKDGKEGSTATALAVVPIDVEKQLNEAKNNGVRTKVESVNPRFNKKKKGKESTSQRIYNSIRKAASLRENKREFKFYCACVGDSRAVLVYESGKTVELSQDHTLRRKDELERIRQAEGEVRYDPDFNEMLVYSEAAQRGLNVTRSIGDSYFKPMVTYHPEIKEGFLTKDAAYFLIASDGLWSHVRSHEVGPILKEFGLKEGIKNLANLSNKRGCYDNCTILAVDVQHLLKRMNDNLDA